MEASKTASVAPGPYVSGQSGNLNAFAPTLWKRKIAYDGGVVYFAQTRAAMAYTVLSRVQSRLSEAIHNLYALHEHNLTQMAEKGKLEESRKRRMTPSARCCAMAC